MGEAEDNDNLDDEDCDGLVFASAGVPSLEGDTGRTLVESYSVGLRPVMILSLIPALFATCEMCSAARFIREDMFAAESREEIQRKSI